MLLTLLLIVTCAGGFEPYLRVSGVADAEQAVQRMAANAAPAALPSDELPAFPGAEGFGSTTPGGRGGGVIKVTNLNDSGPGSLREALEAEGPRIVVFQVGGVIDLQRHIRITNPYLTIAGQTAPGDGVMLRGAGINIVQTHDIIIRGLTIRPGDDPAGPHAGTRRAVTIWGDTANPSYNIIVDHNSLSWSTDEVVGVGYAHDVTFQYNFITEPLHNSIHQEGPHGYAFALYGKDPMDRISAHHNLIAHGYNRNPQYADGVDGEAINNVIYNWGNKGLSVKADALVNIIGNHFIAGPDTPSDSRGVLIGCPGPDCGATRVYVQGNLGPFRPTNSGDDWLVVDGDQQYRSDTPVVLPSGITVDPVEMVYGKLTGPTGAGNLTHERQRDAVEQRILAELETRSGRVRDCVDPAPIYYPQGQAQGATSNTINVEHHPGDTEQGSNPQNRHTYDGNSIEITAGAGAGQVRDVAAFNPWTNVVTVDRPWDIVPDTSSQYRFIIHCDNSAGGWPEYETTFDAPADSDNDGMADEWEVAQGLDPNRYDANEKTLSPEGYDNIEVYINSLIPLSDETSPTPTPTTTPMSTPTSTATPASTATATPPASQCVGDVNSNGVGDVVDIMITASDLPCHVYLPVVAANWRQPWPPAPPAQPSEGPGSSDYAHASYTVEERGLGDRKYWVYQPAEPQPAQAPVVVFLHGWGVLTPNPYLFWLEHLVRKGNIVIYPKYQASWLTPYDTFTQNAIDAVKDALNWLERDPGRVQPDRTKFAMLGHSYGGTIAVNMAHRWEGAGLPPPKAIMPMQPGTEEGGTHNIDSLSDIPATVLMNCHVGADDTAAGRAVCDIIWDRTSHIPAANRDYVVMYSDPYGEPDLDADHRAPAGGPDLEEVDALDWYGFWKDFDALRGCAFYGTNCVYGVGDTPEHRFMGLWSDGAPVRELQITDVKP
ncbi:MAG: alpha/beta hydrolase fold domain-containing protein [Anaerolineae bacterium]